MPLVIGDTMEVKYGTEHYEGTALDLSVQKLKRDRWTDGSVDNAPPTSSAELRGPQVELREPQAGLRGQQAEPPRT
eukprot:4129893-Pyramimonas_sp.AAC.1